MIVVKTKIDKSLISGIGLFADQDIEKGAYVWQMQSISVFKITKNQYNQLSNIEQEFITSKDYYWIDNYGNYMIPVDDSRFINHSNYPNIIDLDENNCISSRYINKGEELTIDYKTLIPKEFWETYML